MSQQKDEKKRARASNFSPDEKVALNLIKTYSHIIENKKTDAVTWQDKSKAWGEIIRVKKEIGTRVRCGDNGSPIGIIIRKN
jgi:hypothetical protein